MLLRNAHLKNVYQHDDLNLRFGPGITGVGGPNGVGKSNLIRAIKGSLINDFAIGTAKRDASIRYGVSDADSYITTNWEHDGVSFEITRGLRPRSNKLAIVGGEILTKVADIDRMLSQLLGIDRHVVEQYIFVDQWELFAFLSASDADRAKSFAYLCNTSKAEIIWNALGDKIKALEPIASKGVDSSDDIHAQMKSTTKELLEHQKEQAELLTKKISDKNFEDLLATQKKLERRCTLDKECRERTVTCERLSIEKREAERKLSEVKAELSQIATELDDNKQTYVAAQQASIFWADLLSTKDAIDETNLEVEKCLTAKPNFDKTAEEMKIISDEVASYRSTLKAAQAIIDNYEETGELKCPTCGAEKQAAHLLEEYRKICDTFPAKITDAEALCSKWNSYSKAIAVWESQYKTLKIDQAALQSEFDSQSLNKPKLSHKKSVAILTKRDELLAEKQELDKKIDDLTKVANRSTDQWSLARELLDGTEKERKELADLDDDDVDERVEEQHSIRQDLFELGIKVDAANKLLSGHQRLLDQIDKKLAGTKSVKHYLDDMRQLRDVFHRDKLPRMAAFTLLEEVTALTNEHLELFEAPFTVSVNDSLAFISTKHNGQDEPALKLSGGEKCVLALAFRLAVNAILGGNIGMLVLDEPTAAMDHRNVEALCYVLSLLGKQMQGKGQQIIIITHDRRLMTACDRFISLGAESLSVLKE